MKQQQVYISGAMTGMDYKEVWLRFKRVQRQLEEAGYAVYNPCCVQLPEGSSHGQYMQIDLPRLLESDIVYFLDGWEKSHGCRYEHQVALTTEKDIRYEAYTRYQLKLKSHHYVWLEQAAEMLQTTVADLTGTKRHRYLCDRRIAIVVYLHQQERLDWRTIGELLHRDRATIYAIYKSKDKAMSEIKPMLQSLCFAEPCKEEPQPLPLFSNGLCPIEPMLMGLGKKEQPPYKAHGLLDIVEQI